VSCDNSHGGRNRGEQKRTWALATNLTGLENSMLLCFLEYSSVTLASRVMDVTLRLFILPGVSGYPWGILGKEGE